MSQQLQNGKQQFFDGNGNPLAGGSVTFYLPGTTTPVNTYQDVDLTIPNTNPVILDSNGMAVIWGVDGDFYRQIVKDASGITYWDQEVGTSIGESLIQSGSLNYAADSGTTANAYLVTLTPTIPAVIPDGFPINMFVSSSRINTGAATLNGIQVVDQNGSDVTQGALSGMVSLRYSTARTAFELVTNAQPVYAVDSIAELKLIKKTPYARSTVMGYYTAVDGGGGTYWYDSTDTTSTDNGGTIIVASDGGRWKLQANELISAKQFGAKLDGTTDDTTAIQNWIAYVFSSGKTGYLPTGVAKVTSQLVFLMNGAVRTAGATFVGDGVGRSKIDVQTVAISPQVLLTSTDTTKDNFYFKMTGIGFFTDTAGIGFQMGAADFSDPVNEPEFDIQVQNFNTAATSVAIALNYVLNGRMRFVANVAGAGTALQCNQATFNEFTGSYSSILGKGVYLTSGFNYGNVFIAPDIENVDTCLVVDGANCQHNTFIGGTWSYATAGVNCTAGTLTKIINPNPNAVAPATSAGFITSATGLEIRANFIVPATPSLPTSGGSVTNTTGMPVQVCIWGGTVTIIAINTYNMSMSGGTFILRPGDTIAIAYSSTPSWVWQPI